jgi:molybdopterin synthase sulfur carrier subunit
MIEKESISVTVKLFANLQELGPDRQELHLSRGTILNEILKKYNLENRKLIILMNGIPNYNHEIKLKDGDVIAIFPPLAGG